jgi:hypothetical protein
MLVQKDEEAIAHNHNGPCTPDHRTVFARLGDDQTTDDGGKRSTERVRNHPDTRHESAGTQDLEIYREVVGACGKLSSK